MSMDSTLPVEAKEMPTTMYMSHKKHPEAKDMMPGDEGIMHVHYRVKSHRKEDDDSGETQVEIHKIEHDGKPKKKKQNAANMPMDKLKDVIKSAQPKEKFNGNDAE